MNFRKNLPDILKMLDHIPEGDRVEVCFTANIRLGGIGEKAPVRGDPQFTSDVPHRLPGGIDPHGGKARFLCGGEEGAVGTADIEEPGGAALAFGIR